MDANLKDDSYKEVYALIGEWILTNKNDYSHFSYRRNGYIPQYPANESSKIYLSLSAMLYSLRFILGQYNIEALYEKHKDNKDYSGIVILSVLEDEKLMAIHNKILEWCERHRKHPDFNKSAKGRTKCYRPTQYAYARYWLWKNYRKQLREFRFRD